MEDQVLYYIPEKSSSSYFFANKGTFQNDMTELVTDFRLWACIESLDTITSSFTIIATPSEGSESYMYVISFQGKDIPNTFEVYAQDSKNIFYVPFDHFLQLQASKTFVPVPDNNWAAHSVRFNTIAALYHLSSLQNLTVSSFSNDDLFLDAIHSFYVNYYDSSLFLPDDSMAIPPPEEVPTTPNEIIVYESYAQQLLSRIFCRLFFDLDFLGFTDPKTLEQKTSLDAIKDLVKQLQDSHFQIFSGQTFAFGELKYAIQNYFESINSNNEKSIGKMDPENWHSLQQTIAFVSHTLYRKGFIGENPSEDNLRSAISAFQNVNGIPQGACNPFTLRYIWFTSLEDGCNLSTICKLCNVNLQSSSNSVNNNIDFPEVIDFKKTIEPVKIDNPTPEFSAIEDALNSLLTKVKTREEGAQWLTDETELSLKTATQRVKAATERAHKLEKTVEEAGLKLQSSSEMAAKAAQNFDEAAHTIDLIIQEHNEIQKEYSELKNRYSKQKMGNQILLCLVVLIIVIVFMKLFRK